jgi:hypothetical protein
VDGVGEEMESSYNNREIRDRIDVVSERVIRAEGRQEGHEAICAQRYAQILKELAELRAVMTLVSKVGLFLAFVLFTLELGRATFPSLFEFITKGMH